MTTREKIGKLLDQLSDEELATAYRRLRQTAQGEPPLGCRSDDFGRLSAQASCGVLRRMTEDEETAGLSWEEFRPGSVGN